MNNKEYRYLTTDKEVVKLFSVYTKKIHEGVYKEDLMVSKEDVSQDLFLVADKTVDNWKKKYPVLGLNIKEFRYYLARAFSNYLNDLLRAANAKKNKPEVKPLDLEYLERTCYPELTEKQRNIVDSILDCPEFIDNPEHFIKERSGKLNLSRISEVINVPRKTIERSLKS